MAKMVDVSSQGRKIYILFHRGCMDGAGARFAAWKKFGSRATYIDVQYREPLPEMEDGSEVYILDFSYSRDILEQLNKRMSKLVVLDHHETAKNDLQDLPYATFNMKKSGAMMAWEYFHPEKSIPEILYLVQDRDLWQFQMPDTKKFHAGFQTRREYMNDWEKAADASQEGRYLMQSIKNEGRLILQYEEAQIKTLLSRVKYVRFLHTRVGIVNSSVLKDELAEAIYANKDNPVQAAIVYTIEPESQKALLSFRGAPDTDWSWVARHLGGGGHKRSCNAAVDLTTLQQILDGRFLKLPRETWIGKLRTWLNSKLRYWEEALHGV